MWIAPDGVEVLGMVFNGQFPGPVIEANCPPLSTWPESDPSFLG
jgi:hypothetical protein